jgi:thiol:disulfide interchange protein DsbC
MIFPREPGTIRRPRGQNPNPPGPPMRIAAPLFTLALAFATAFPALAQELDRIKADLQKKFPQAQFDTVRKAGYGSLFEVTGGGEIFYTDEKTSFLLVGTLIDTKTRENVTEARQRKLSAVPFESLPFDNAIKIVRGNGARKIAIFEDPNCGYCKRFEKELANVTDLTVYVFLYPILSPESTEKSANIWCAADRPKAWLDYMLKDVAPAAAKCPTPLEANVQFGQGKRITGTPTIFFEDGERVPGAMSIASFEKRLADATAATAAKKK